MRRDESLTAAMTPPLDTTATRLVEMLTVADVAALLKVSKSWVYEHTRARHAAIRSTSAHQDREVRALRFAARTRIPGTSYRRALTLARQAATMARELQHEEPARGKGLSR
jgi:hypothetical protein